MNRLLDACALINLYASGCLKELAEHLGLPFLIVPEVVREAGWVFKRHGKTRGPRVPIDLQPLRDLNLIRVVPLGPAAQQHFLRLAGQVDDGEAATIAAAFMLGESVVVTDDDAALRLLTDPALPPGVTSLGLLRGYLDPQPPPIQREALLNLQICGRYTPGPRHPELDWWSQVLSE